MAESRSPEDYWQMSTAKSTAGNRDESALKVRSSVGERYGGSTSVVWTAISQLPPQERAGMMAKLVGIWPYGLEKRAFTWPMHATILATMASSALITTAVNREFFHFGVRLGFLETVNKSPKSPFVMGIYAAGVSHYMLNQVFNAMYNTDERPCSSCLLTNAVMTGIGCGIVVPALATPFLAYYIVLRRENSKHMDVKTISQFIGLLSQGLKIARPLLPQLIGLQVVVAAASTFAMLWARNRIFDTIDVDPDLVKDLLIKAQEQQTPHERVMNWFRHYVPWGSSGFFTAPEDQKRA